MYSTITRHTPPIASSIAGFDLDHCKPAAILEDEVDSPADRKSRTSSKVTVKYGILFLIVSGVFAYYGYLIGGWGWLLWWPALSFLTVACGYLGLGTKIFGKRTDGTIAWHVFPYLLPYLLYTWAIWHLSRILLREDCYNEISPGIYIGRRVLAYELPQHVKAIVDLTAEFPEPAGVRIGRQYLCLPTLDAGVPTDSKFKALVDTVMRISEPMYIHCAEGHGCSGTLAAAVLLLKGQAKDVEEAVIKLQAMRSGIRLNDKQKALVRRVCPDLLKERAEPQVQTANARYGNAGG